MEQEIIDRVVKIATNAAMNGTPVKRIIWLESAAATGDRLGAFAVEYYQQVSVTHTPPWKE